MMDRTATQIRTGGLPAFGWRELRKPRLHCRRLQSRCSAGEQMEPPSESITDTPYSMLGAGGLWSWRVPRRRCRLPWLEVGGNFQSVGEAGYRPPTWRTPDASDIWGT